MGDRSQFRPPLSLLELAKLVDSIRWWTDTHPDDDQAAVVLARVEAEYAEKVKPWHQAMSRLGKLLDEEENDG